MHVTYFSSVPKFVKKGWLESLENLKLSENFEKSEKVME